MTRALSAIALLVLFAPAPANAGQIAYINEAGDITRTVDVADPYEPETDGPPYLVAGDKPVRRQPKCKTSGVYQSVEFLPTNTKVFSADLHLRWCRDRWRISNTAAWGQHYSGGWFAGFFYKYDGESKIAQYAYQYKGHGLGSGWVARQSVYFKLCVDPFKAICPVSRVIDLDLHVHADGTVKRTARVRT